MGGQQSPKYIVLLGMSFYPHIAPPIFSLTLILMHESRETE